MARLDAFLQLGCAQGCSDIHLAMGVPPMLRLHGDLLPVKYRDLDDEELTSLLREIVTDGQWATFMAGHDLDFSYAQEGIGRFRVNLFQKTQGIGATFRVIPSQVPTLDTLGLPPVVQQLTQVHQGLVLVHRGHWHGEIDDPGGDAAPSQHHQEVQYHHPGRSHRMYPYKRYVAGRAARGWHARGEFCGGVTRGVARGPGRDSRR